MKEIALYHLRDQYGVLVGKVRQCAPTEVTEQWGVVKFDGVSDFRLKLGKYRIIELAPMAARIGVSNQSNGATVDRDGIRPDGTLIGPPMPIPFYRSMSDKDVKAIVAYLGTVKPVNNAVPRSQYNIPLPQNYGPPVGNVPEASKDDPIAYGRYLTHSLGHCTDCHTPMEKGQFIFSRTGEGGRVFKNIFGLDITTVSRNITPNRVAGLGAWTAEQIKQAITDGVSRDGRELAKAMAFPYYKKISDEDLNAIVAYLRSLEPLPRE